MMSQHDGQRTVCGFWASPFMAFVAQVLIEAELDFQYLRVSPFAGEVQSDAHRARNPLAKIPTLIEPDGAMISESQAICRYLARSYPSAQDIYPCDDIRLCAQIDALNDFFTFTVAGPFFNWLVIGGYFPNAFKLKCEVESEIFSKLSMVRVKDGLQRIMGGAELSPYLLGSKPYMPDFQLYQLLEAGKVFGTMLNMPALDLTAGNKQLTGFCETMALRKSSQSITQHQNEELPRTRTELFEVFPQIRAPQIRAGLGPLLGHEV